MLKKLTDKIDIFGFTPCLEVNKKQEFKSSFGFLTTLIIASTIIYSIWHFGKDIIYKTQPRIIVSEYIDEDPLPISLSPDKLEMVIALTFENSITAIDNSIYNLEIEHRSDLRFPDGSR
jgi:hypothetical protein